MSVDHYETLIEELDQQNSDLKRQLTAYSQEVQTLTQHLQHSLDENESLTQQIYRMENDLAEERIENASREHFLLRQNTPGVDSLRNSGSGPSRRSRVSFYGISDEEESTSPESTGRSDSASVFGTDNERTPIRPNSVTELISSTKHQYIDSNKVSTRRCMSYHDISDIHRRDTLTKTHRCHSYQAPDDEYHHDDQEIGYFEDELVSSSYYAEGDETLVNGTCSACKESESQVQELEGHIGYLEEQFEDKDRFIENLDFEITELKTQLRALKLDKDIAEYELNEQIDLSKGKLDETEQSLNQKDQAYMDLLERFVSIERNFEDVNTKYKANLKECTGLTERVNLTEFDLIMAEERLRRYSRRLFDFETSSDSSGSPTENRRPYKYNSPAMEKRSSMSGLEKCSLDQQPLSMRSSGSSLDLWDLDEEEYNRLENLRKARREAERHAKIGEMLSSAKTVSAFDLFQITKELAGMEDDEVKENVPHAN